jgi:hypothetical protein
MKLTENAEVSRLMQQLLDANSQEELETLLQKDEFHALRVEALSIVVDEIVWALMEQSDKLLVAANPRGDKQICYIARLKQVGVWQLCRQLEPFIDRVLSTLARSQTGGNIEVAFNPKGKEVK